MHVLRILFFVIFVDYCADVLAQDQRDISVKLPMGLAPTQVIDLYLEKAWVENNLKPAARSEDPVFVRRLYLDLMGRVPNEVESNRFLACTESNKREALVDSLLASDEHANHLAEVLDALLIGRTNENLVRQRTNAGWFRYLKDAIQKNRPWNEIVRESILARPDSSDTVGASWYIYSRKNNAQDIAEAISKDFFGVRIDCAQCHDHPLASEIEQRHYWGLVAFFNRSKNVDTADGPRVSESAIGGFSEFSNLEGQSLPNELVFLGGRRVQEQRPAKDVKEVENDELYEVGKANEYQIPKFSRRAKFVQEVLNDHPLLAKAMTNKMWGLLMGRGIVHPVDALDSYHPASHAELLEWLGQDFAHSGYDLRRLIKSLVLSKAYQLESASGTFVDPKWYTTAIAKPLTAEMLHRSLLLVMDPIDLARWDTLEVKMAFANLFPDILPEESIANVSQGLMLTNGPAVNQLVSVESSKFLKSLVANSDNEQAIRSLFMRVLGREPDSEELNRCMSFVSQRSDRRTLAIEGLAWALVTGAEFRFNH